MKTLVIAAHPNIAESRINKAWLQELQKHADITVHQLYDAYPDKVIDAAKEQALLEAHDRIILQFPLFWYSSPSLLKEWLDSVLAYGWAYGSGGNKLHGKQFGLAISTGGPAEAYAAGGYNRFTLPELTKPFEATSNLIGTQYLPMFVLSGVRNVSDEELAQSCADYLKHVTSDSLVPVQ
jgi:glutathione-regulated potassium-efflux system ancillary protein KefG